MKSVLVGNGFNCQFGYAFDKSHNAYSNRFILQRIIFNAKASSYNKLFGNKLSGEDIENIFKGLVGNANKARSGGYDDIIKHEIDFEDLAVAIEDFKDRYKNEIEKTYEIGLEDWFLLLRLFFVDNSDVASEWQAAKQGFEQVILDAIYNDGQLQNIHSQINKKAMRYFSLFDNIFTLNYDNNLEALTKKTVYHLHGDYEVTADSENTDTLQGYIRHQKGENIPIQKDFKHCYCNALLDYSGQLKLNRAENIEKIQDMLERFRVLHESDIDEFNRTLANESSLAHEYTHTYIDNPHLRWGTNYHFREFTQLSGELVIIGMSPNNDSHIFDCINKSNIDNVVFYHFYANKSDPQPKLRLKKPYKVENINELWESLDCAKKRYNGYEPMTFSPEFDKWIDIFNLMSGDAITKTQISDEMKALPQYEARRLYNLVAEELKEKKYHTSAASEAELMSQWYEITRIALREGIFPAALFMIYIRLLSTENKGSVD